MTALRYLACWVVGLSALSLCQARHIDYDLLKELPDWRRAALLERQADTTGSACFRKCSATNSYCTTSNNNCDRASKRSLEIDFDAFNSTSDDYPNEAGRLLKRTLPRVAASQVGVYLDRQNDQSTVVALAPQDVGDEDYYQSRTGAFAPSFCFQQQFSTFDPNGALSTNGALLIGTGQTLLTGCTILTIVSARAVYMCHIWEERHFTNPGEEDPGDLPAAGIQPILNLFQGSGPTDYAYGPPVDTSLFNQASDSTYAFLMTPRSFEQLTNPNAQRYPNQLSQIKQVLQQLIPGIGIFDYNYRPYVQYQRLYGGQALFEYDPTGSFLSSNNPDWRLWYEQYAEYGHVLGQRVD